jgi:hypothetical protein
MEQKNREQLEVLAKEEILRTYIDKEFIQGKSDRAPQEIEEAISLAARDAGIEPQKMIDYYRMRMEEER